MLCHASIAATFIKLYVPNQAVASAIATAAKPGLNTLDIGNTHTRHSKVTNPIPTRPNSSGYTRLNSPGYMLHFLRSRCG